MTDPPGNWVVPRNHSLLVRSSNCLQISKSSDVHDTTHTLGSPITLNPLISEMLKIKKKFSRNKYAESNFFLQKQVIFFTKTRTLKVDCLAENWNL